MEKAGFNYQEARERFFKYVPMALLALAIAAAIFIYAMIIVFVPTQNGDNIEHIHSSFLIVLGQVPYRDFFQHHNPLLWYLFAPLVKLFAYNATITEIVSFVSFLFFLKSLVYVYRISAEFLSDKLWGLAAAATIAMPGYKIYAADFRPDNYMVLCLMGGIYYYFSYLKVKKPFHLAAAFAWFFTAFLFAQKALFPLAVLGGTALYFWYRRDIQTRDMLKALIFPLAGSLGFGYYLYHYDMLDLYYASNYTFNLELVKGFELSRVVNFPPYMAIVIWLGFFGAAAALKCGNRYWLLTALLFVTEFIQRRFYFSPYSYYYWLLIYFAVLCGMPLLCAAYRRNRAVIWVVIAGLYWFLYLICGFWQVFIEEQGKRPYLPDYISRKITPCDYVFNGDGMMYNIFGKDPAYYWQLIGQLDVIGERVGIAPRPNVNELIMKLRPKFIYGKNYFNKFADENGRAEIVHYVDKEMVNRMYGETGFGSVYQLKAEYDGRKCRKNPADGVWRYEE